MSTLARSRSTNRSHNSASSKPNSKQRCCGRAKAGFHGLDSGREYWEIGSKQEIRWVSQQIRDSVSIRFSSDAGASWQQIARLTDAHRYDWTVADVPSDSCLILICDWARLLKDNNLMIGYLAALQEVSDGRKFASIMNQDSVITELDDRAMDLTAELSVYNILGQRVRSLTDGERPARYYEIFWDGTDDLGRSLNLKLYFYRLSIKDADQAYQVVDKMYLPKWYTQNQMPTDMSERT